MRKSLYLHCITAILLSVGTPVAFRGHCQDKIGPHTTRHGTVQANPRPAEDCEETTERIASPSAKAIEPQRLVANRTKTTMGSENELTKANDENFASLVHNRKGLVLVEFYADWCGPCKMQEVILRQLASTHDDVSIVKVNVSESPSVSGKYVIRRVPALLLFKGDKVLKSRVGLTDAVTIKSWIDKYQQP